MSHANEGIAVLLVLKDLDPELYASTLKTLELDMWDRIGPHNLLTPKNSTAAPTELLAKGRESIGVALSFFEDMTECGLMDKTLIVATFNAATTDTKSKMLSFAKENGAPESILTTIERWFDLYTSTINEAFAELLHPRPQLEPELDARAAT